jgi:hypothetical protein
VGAEFADHGGVRGYAAGLQQIERDLERQIPHSSEGLDATGAVRVVIGADGLPLSIDVVDDWKRNVRPAAFAQAVQSAYRAGSNKRLKAWLTAFNDADLSMALEIAASTSPPPPPAPRPVEGPRPRDPGAFAEELLQLAAAVDTDLETPPPRGEGVFGKLTLTLTPTTLLCAVDEFWVSDRSGAELTTALASALASARADLDKVAASNPLGRAMSLLDTALSTMTRLASGR